MRVLALNGSSSSTSIHRTLIDLVAAALGPEVETDVANLTDLPAPLYSVDLEKAGYVPQSMRELAARIQASDAVVFASPEHNGLPPAILKNAIDWLSRLERGTPWLAKPVVMVSTSPGPNGGASNLEHLARLAPFWGATVVGSYSLGGFYKAVDGETGQLRDPAEQARLEQALSGLREPRAALAAK